MSQTIEDEPEELGIENSEDIERVMNLLETKGEAEDVWVQCHCYLTITRRDSRYYVSVQHGVDEPNNTLTKRELVTYLRQLT